MIRCHSGSVSVDATAPTRRAAHDTTAPRFVKATTSLDHAEYEPAWSIKCSDCGRVLTVVHGPREEVFADL